MTAADTPWYNVVLALPAPALRLVQAAGGGLFPPPPAPWVPRLTLRWPSLLRVDETTAAAALSRALHPVPPLTISIEGWGVYPSGTVYLQVLPSPQLLRVHAVVRQTLEPISRELMPERDGPAWHPHIDISPAAIDDLAALVGRLRSAAFAPHASFGVNRVRLARREEENTWQVVHEVRLGVA